MLSGSSGVPGGFTGFSMKSPDAAGVVGVDAAERRRLGAGHPDAGNGGPGTALDVEPHHLFGVHSVNVVSAENDDVVGIFVIDQVHRLVDRVSGTGVPARPQALLCRNRSDVLAGQAAQPPVLRDVAVQGMGLVLGQYADLEETRIDEVGEHEVDKPVGAAEGNRGFSPVSGQRVQPLAFPTGQDDAQHLWRFPHVTNLTGAFERC